MKKGELMPCPHCCGEVEIGEVHPPLPNGTTDTLYAIYCKKCGMGTNKMYPRAALVSAWNRRVMPPEVRELVEEVKAALRGRVLPNGYEMRLTDKIAAVESVYDSK